MADLGREQREGGYSGPRLVSVPDVVGLSLRKALLLIQRAGLRADMVLYQESYEEKDKVLQQDPSIATGAGHHSVIRLHVPAEDKYFIVYHRRPRGETDPNHRVVCIDRMEFDDDGLIKPVKITFDGVEKLPVN